MSADLFGSVLSTGLRGSSGINTRPASHPPAQRLRLYDIENCPYCRLVREALTELNLDVEIYPCPKGGERFRPEVVAMGGKAQFPFLFDPNDDSGRYESLDIIAYLYDRYAKRRLPLKWWPGPAQTFSSSLASLPRLAAPARARPGRVPPQMLELYSFESSPFARLVREELCALEIPYIVRQCGRTRATQWLPPAVRERLDLSGGELPNRRYLLEHTGRMAVPYLRDPNRGEGMYESADIIAYLREHYGEP
ncbi:glutathione S-transferase N-terminal domain-containing protein [Parahaliea mediterranea]|uniref:Glutathione S-transferase N-terminal domain-containing protein n=1 Tax=Parahaliea mediterranea TaxID=651086 RepID=A0A939IM56_9GAMM|nr:glutathione S-transferase N-terminal domain-containing protein [Parahaliea mediterranea]MBN7796667.1 glutathione S-transferase N-terminal domain-containing protein [Parahaliea mediterranea]